MVKGVLLVYSIAMKRPRSGFTVIELLIVIVVIAILAAISIVAYRGISERAQKSALQSDLSNAARFMQVAKAGTDVYPTSLSGFSASANTVLSLSEAGNGFCINGESKTNATLRWSYASSIGGLQEGLCSGAVIGGSEVGIKPNLITDTSFTGSGPGNGTWQVSRGGGSGSIVATTRAGQSGDPYPSRPVLRYTNTADASVTWGVINGRIDATQIQQGKTYTQVMYARLASGAFVGNPAFYSVRDANNNNAALPGAWTSTPLTSDWQKYTRTVTASANGIASNLYYLPLQSNQSQNASWVVEMQGLELREQ